MATQPPRPWFRLATMVRPPPTQPPPQPARPTLTRPTFAQVQPRPPAPSVTKPIVPKATLNPTTSPPPTISRPPSPRLLKPHKPESKEIPDPKGNNNTTTTTTNSSSSSNSNNNNKSNNNNNSDSDDVGMRRIITLSGENKGAMMDLSKNKDKPTPSTNSEAKNKYQKAKSPLMRAFMNSNVQGVNNSILYNCSTSHHDPGVHLSLSRKPSSGIK